MNTVIVSPHILHATIVVFQEKRDLSKNMKYVELLLVADKAEVRTKFEICMCKQNRGN